LYLIIKNPSITYKRDSTQASAAMQFDNKLTCVDEIKRSEPLFSVLGSVQITGILTDGQESKSF
jgi:hypothetical protein